MTFTKTSLANRALDLIGKETLLNLDDDTSATAKVMQRNYEPVLLRCLRKSDWPWAIKRLTLNPSVTAPVNEFSYAFDEPPDLERLIRVFPDGIRYKRENGQIICDESALTVKYVSNASIANPSVMDPAFAEWFAHELAVAVSYKFTDSVVLRSELRKEAEARFREAAALYSQEDIDDEMAESPWVSARTTPMFDDGTIRISGLE